MSMYDKTHYNKKTKEQKQKYTEKALLLERKRKKKRVGLD